MEGAAADHRVVMGSMDVGWSDLGSWTALLAALAGGDPRGATGRVVQTGETIDVGADDLLIRPAAGTLAVGTGPEGTIVADSVWAHLSGARHLQAQVQALLDRVAHQEGRV
jgi:mannose-1-phosphate guanylyltransferase